MRHSISIIGSGNVATNLAFALCDAGYTINEICSRNINHAAELSDQIPGCVPTSHVNLSNSESRIFILSVNDDAIEHMASQIKLPLDSYIFHTSGTVDLGALSQIQANRGILYPLQTFSRNQMISFDKVPLLIEGDDLTTSGILFELGESISEQVLLATSEERRQLHLAAVFASNFTNRMLAAAQDLLSSTSLDLEMLKPLVNQSLKNAFKVGPDQALTGPAKRGDLATLTKHEQLLQSHPDLLTIYELLSQKIVNKFGESTDEI